MAPFDDPEVCRGILESLPTGLCVINLEKKILFWSKGAERITGHVRHEVIGHSCVAEPLLHCDQPGCEFCSEFCPVARAMKSSQRADATGFLHHKNGHEIPVRIRAVPVHNGRGSIIGAVETFEDLQPEATGAAVDANQATPDYIDHVTGVASRAMMHSHLQRRLCSSAEDGSFRILLLQVHRLAHFRASLGTEAASSLLRVIARTLEACLSTSDLIGRWSDDQFLLILHESHDEGMEALRERIRRMLAGEGIEWWGERRSLPVFVGASTAQTGDTVESLLHRVLASLEAALAPARTSPARSASAKGS
jgi:diguanylate cyclase (GGDEF)-like protein/PAS domain S-box-containing protein